MMKTTQLILLLLLASTAVFGQLQDDFSDGDFTNNPEWLGQADKFAVTDQKLQLLDPEPNSNNQSYLYTTAPTSNEEPTIWEFFVQQDFAPSASNYAQVYLSASNPGLTGSQEAYYVKIGGVSGSVDAVELFRQDGNASTLLISGTEGSVGAEPAIARIRVSRSANGEWTLFADYSGGTNFQNEGSATDNTYSMGGFFGFVCNYTSTRNEAFFFDDVLVDPLFTDTTPPELVSAQAVNATTVVARFNEPLSEDTATDPANYTIDQGIGAPASVSLTPGDPTQVSLQLSNPLENTFTYQLTANNIADLADNVATAQSTIFEYFEFQVPETGEVIITEIMADPNPTVELPEGEYIELYNNSDKVIALENLSFSSGSPVALPAYILLPGTYVAIVEQEWFDQYNDSGPIIAINALPALSNGADDLSLINESGTIIFELSYTDDWYRDLQKKDGGYSLELIDLNGPYDCPGNWRASQDGSGGTPGLENSWAGTTPDDIPPTVITALANDGFEIIVQFSEQMDITSISDASNYTLDNGILIESALPQENNQVLLLASEALQAGTRYNLQLNTAITDCMGNALDNNTFQLGLAEALEAKDLVINEILFNPVPTAFDYLELYNRSDKAININGIIIENAAKLTGNIRETITQDYLLFPGEYVVLTEEPLDISTRFFVERPEALLENDLPTFEDKEGNVTLRFDGITIDSFDYEERFHFPLLNDKDGVSLERLSAEAPTQDEGNWHSAASTVGFGTPTYQNSQFFPQNTQLEQTITLANTTFSPDGDGFEDVLVINYQTDAPGYTLNVRIFDSNGREVRQLLNNEILADSGTFQWDGTTTAPSKPRIGIYIIWFELFSPDGKIERDKKACVLAGQLD
jgi:hypothetical protein